MSRRGAASLLLALYLVLLGFVAAWPTPVDRPLDAQLLRVIDRIQEAGFPWVDYAVVESAANVVLFVPLGVLLAALFRRGWVVLALVGVVAATVTIELVQREFLPARVSSLGDIAANSVGGALGVGLVVLVRATRWSRRRRAARA
ncbi:MAG: VanZ family protein [Micrococcales bacterium]|nr:VanZ family protein [Micrococcales bacterium]